MDTTTIVLDDRRFKAATKRAEELGTTPEDFINSLIDAATLTFDEILSPVREAFAASGSTENDLDDAVAEARGALRKRPPEDVKS
jgi:hypothetical protein